MRSLTAAGKFKKRRHKQEKLTQKQVTPFIFFLLSVCVSSQTMGAFLSWFGNSQALDRIIKLERMGVTDEKIMMEMNYMIKKVPHE